jgi:chromate reductase
MVPFRARVLPGPEVMVAHSREAFDEAGRLKDAHYVKSLSELMQLLRAEIGR